MPQITLENRDVNMLLIFDSSVSMSNTIEGKRKIDLAKEAVSAYITYMTDADIALRLYGHRNQECTDTELVYPFGTTDPKKLTEAVNRMEPTGMTPIEYSLRQAVNDLPSTGENIVVLVSDGEETCGGDPCAAVRELAAAGAGFTLHTVGFGISGEGKDQLKCMAAAGGGQYFDAPTADQLAAALYKVKQIISNGNTLFLDGVEFSIPEVTLNIRKDGLNNIVMQYRNTKQKPTDFDYKVKLYLVDEKGNVVDTKTASDSLNFRGLIDAAERTVCCLDGVHSAYTNSFKAVHQPGVYAVKADFYDSQEKYVAGTLYRTFTLGPESPAVAAQKPPKMDAPEQSAELDGVVFTLQSIAVSDGRDGLKGSTIWARNTKQATAIFSYRVKFYLVNDKSELVDFTDSSHYLNGRDLRDLFTNYYSLHNTAADGLHRTQVPGTYTLLARIYAESSNMPEKFIAKKVQLGSGVPSVDSEPLPKMEFSSNSVLDLGGVDFSVGKVSLSSAKDSFENYILKYTNKQSAPAKFTHSVKSYLINDKGEIADFTNSARRLYTGYGLTGSDEVEIYLRLNIAEGFKVGVHPAGTYTLLLRFYTEGSNVPQGDLTKTVQLGAAAPTEQ